MGVGDLRDQEPTAVDLWQSQQVQYQRPQFR